MSKKEKFSYELIGRNVLSITDSTVKSGWAERFFLMSDIHLDSRHCKRELFFSHLKLAQETGTPVFIFGDLFDAMQGKWDPRGSKSDLIPELQHSDYLDRVIEWAADQLKPYTDVIKLITPGNHETSIRKRYETDLTQRLIERLNTNSKHRVYPGGYSGFVRFKFGKGANSGTMTKVLAYHHGYGGDSPVTKGVIQTSRMAVYLPDAHIVVTGHSHTEYVVPIGRVRMSTSGELYQDEQLHVKVPGYKEEYGDGSEGWAIEKGFPPKTNGAMALTFKYTPEHRPVANHCDISVGVARLR